MNHLCIMLCRNDARSASIPRRPPSRPESSSMKATKNFFFHSGSAGKKVGEKKDALRLGIEPRSPAILRTGRAPLTGGYTDHYTNGEAHDNAGNIWYINILLCIVESSMFFTFWYVSMDSLCDLFAIYIWGRSCAYRAQRQNSRICPLGKNIK